LLHCCIADVAPSTHVPCGSSPNASREQARQASSQPFAGAAKPTFAISVAGAEGLPQNVEKRVGFVNPRLRLLIVAVKPRSGLTPCVLSLPSWVQVQTKIKAAMAWGLPLHSPFQSSRLAASVCRSRRSRTDLFLSLRKAKASPLAQYCHVHAPCAGNLARDCRCFPLTASETTTCLLRVSELWVPKDV